MPWKCECCEIREGAHWMDWGEWLCDDCMNQALAEDAPETDCATS